MPQGNDGLPGADEEYDGGEDSAQVIGRDALGQSAASYASEENSGDQ